MKIELLLGRDCGEIWEICGVTYFGASSFGSEYVTLRASKVAIEAAKIALQNGKQVVVSKNHEYVEILPSDLVIEKVDDLVAKKRIALNDVNYLMHQNILGVCITDAFSYLKSYMDLLASGIFISNANREDKYFEIIEAAQSNPEQDWLEKKRQHRIAQDNFKTLETYLNSLDKIQKIDFVNNVLKQAKDNIENASSEAEIEKAVAQYKEIVYSHFYTPYGSTDLIPKTTEQLSSNVK